MNHDNSSTKWHFFASGQFIGKRSSGPETRRPRLLSSINNSWNLVLLKIKKFRKAKNRYDILHMFHCFHHNFLIRCQFDEVFSGLFLADLCEHFDTKFEFFPYRMTKIEFSETAGCGPSGTGETSYQIGF